MRATSDRTRLEAAIGAAKVGSGATRYGPALKLADSILSRSPIKRREAVLISDFQRSGWSGSEEVRFPDGDDGQHRVGRLSGRRQPGGSLGDLRARVVLGAGADHRHRRPEQQGRRAGRERAGHADHRRPRDPDRASDGGAARVGLGLLHPVHAHRFERARLDQGRHRPDAGRQRVPFRARAERAGVAGGRRQRRPRRTAACSCRRRWPSARRRRFRWTSRPRRG